MSNARHESWRGVPWDERFEAWAYPIAIVNDRYGGVYSGGKWLAIAGIDNPRLGGSVLKMLARDGGGTPNPWGGDEQAGFFWRDPPAWIAVGDTPEKALAPLKAKNSEMNWPFDDDQRAT